MKCYINKTKLYTERVYILINLSAELNKKFKIKWTVPTKNKKQKVILSL